MSATPASETGHDASSTSSSLPPSTSQNMLKNFISGGVGGVFLVLAGQPFDMVKVQLQASSSSFSSSSTSSAKPSSRLTARIIARDILAKEGIRGLYRGMSAPLLGVTPIFAVCFWAYDVAKQSLVSMYGLRSEHELSLLQIGVAGAASAIPTTAIMAPGERIKVLLQTSSSSSSSSAAAAAAAGGGASAGYAFKGPGDVVRHLVKTEGIRSLFRGSLVTLLRDGIGSFAYFGVYEGIKRYSLKEERREEGDSKQKKAAGLSPTAVILGGGFAGVCNWIVAIPFDTIKSRIQMQKSSSSSSSSSSSGGSSSSSNNSGIWGVGAALVKKEGSMALFKGMGPALLRAFPANAACFMGMEFSKAAMDKFM